MMRDRSLQFLALHGFTGCGADFAPLRQLLGGLHETATAPIGWHCPDLPGHGPDPSLDCSPRATLDFLQMQASAFDAQHSTFDVLLAYSMGARAALLHATVRPDAWDALILVSPNPGIEAESERAGRRRSDHALADRIEREGLEAFLEFWQQQPLIRSQQSIPAPWSEAMRANRLRHTAQGLAASLRQFGQGSCPDLWPDLPKLTMPVLLLTGEADAKYTATAERMHRALPNARHLSIPASGHAPHLERPSPACQAIRSFLNDARRL